MPIQLKCPECGTRDRVRAADRPTPRRPLYCWDCATSGRGWHEVQPDGDFVGVKSQSSVKRERRVRK